ncbi:MAG: protein kinase [Verrucomicrobia bacterium]|nr:protein kinase [Verrucomicrobiota bacterium]
MNESSPDPFHGLNPADLMAAAAMPTDGGADTIPLNQRDLPSLEEIATAFPDLEIFDLIGHGGMSAVFRVRQPKLDRIVALKVLPKSLAATPGFAERFNREGRVLARLSHPSIVAVHDFGESGGFAYLIMEFVDGVNLRQAMRAGRFTPDQALKIIPAICEALQFAHTQGVLHRDIKPENILLDSKGRVKIADFGIAKIISEDSADAMLLTQSGAKLGTAPYMAPEQIEQPSTVDHRADIYSLGVVFYEMLTGELPLGRFAAPSERSTCNGNVDEVVFRALEKERGRRQQSAGEMKTQIEEAATVPRSKLGRTSGAPMRLLKLGGTTAGAIFVCANVFLLRKFFQVLQQDSLNSALSVLLLNVGGFSLILNLALWLRLVPINRIYGVQSPATLTSSTRWYEVNAHFGKHAFWWSLAVISAGIAGFYQLPRHQDAFPWAAITLSLVAFAASVISTLWWMRQHPVGAPPQKKNRLASWSGQVVVAVVIAMFIKSFIAGAYRIPQGNEPGVAKNSHWIASHLDTGFSTGDLIIFEHESGNYWIARVVAREPKGLRLKRGGSPDEFIIPWDKIVGKMLFSHFSPDVMKVEKVVAPARDPVSIPETSSKALDTSPVLRFSRLKRSQADWRWPVYALDGSPIENAISQPLIRDASHADHEGLGKDDCWWQLWFQHPDFDGRSMVHVSITHLDGSEISGRYAGHAGPAFASPGSPACVVISPGSKGSLPKAVRMVLRYSIGPWTNGSKVKSTFNGFMSFKHGELGGFGEGLDKSAFITWLKKADEWQPDVNARLLDGRWISWNGASSSMRNEQIIQKFEFEARLGEIEYFQTRTRAIRTLVFDKVLVPPLPDDENARVSVQVGPDRSSPVKWKPGLTVAEAIGQLGDNEWKSAKVFRLIRDGQTTNYSFQLAETTETKPDDQILLPE